MALKLRTKTRLYLLPGNNEQFIVRRGEPLTEAIPVATQLRMSSPILLEFVHDGVPVRQAEEDGEFQDVFLITQVHTKNETNRSYHLSLIALGTVFYEDQLPGGTEKFVDLAQAEQFEDYGLGFSITATG